ncbi:MAG TPA: hypothetical protein VK961_17130 [Chthoniobacter sp.]|nr:hypothetical protein [Chthoniobacter sp.]
MKALPPKLRAKHRRLLNFMLSPEFSQLSTAMSGIFPTPPHTQKPGTKSGSNSAKPRRHHGIWCIDTAEGKLVLNATFSKRPNGKVLYRSRWSFVPAELL